MIAAPAYGSLDKWLEYISASHPSEIELGLERVSQVWSRIKPDRAVAKRVVTVAGTNGKGSTIAMLERMMLQAGLSVGCYTSPHIESYNERLRFNGALVDDSVLVTGFEAVEAGRDDRPLTYFEFGTLSALWSLSQAELDVVLLEVGLGGRLDAVNVVDADVAVITSIGLDHTDWLGDDLEQIGVEKSGIMRRGKPVVLGKGVTRSVIESAKSLSCPFLLYGRDFELAGDWVQLAFSNGVSLEWPGSLLPESNVLAALAVASILSERFSELDLSEPSSLKDYLQLAASTVVPGRMEPVSRFKGVYLDVAHNAQAAAHLRERIQALQSKQGRVYVVFSSLEDKDVSEVGQALSEVVDCWLLAPLSCDRAMSLSQLEKLIGQHAKDMLSFASMDEAIGESINMHEGDDLVLIFGSFFVVEAAKAYFSNYE